MVSERLQKTVYLEATKSDLVKGLQKVHEEVLVEPEEKALEEEQSKLMRI